MIAHLRGELSAIYEDRIIIDVSGIGYNVMMPASSISILPGIGNMVKIYTYLSVREDAMWLYGFTTKDELDLFKLLITVNGVGPKAGLQLLSFMGINDLKFAVMASDVKSISKAPGVGPKTAQRIIIDLKDKIELLDTFESKLTNTMLSTASASMSEAMTEACDALVALGYSQKDALSAVKSVEPDDDASVEDILKAALRSISRI